MLARRVCCLGCGWSRIWPEPAAICRHRSIPLRRKLELAQLVAGLIDADPSLAPATARFDLADSLTALMDEMHGEGVPPHVIEELDVSDQSGHWQRALSFVRLIARYFEADARSTSKHGSAR